MIAERPFYRGDKRHYAMAETNDLSDQLFALIGQRTTAVNIRRSSAVVLRYLLCTPPTAGGYMDRSLRRMSSELRLSVSELRTALERLLRWGWIERGLSVSNSSGRYRLTRAFAAVVMVEDIALYRTIRDALLRLEAEQADNADHQRTVDTDFRQAVQAFSLTQLIRLIFELNRFQRQHYRRAYNKRTLCNSCTLLHWFLQQDAQQPGAPMVISLTRLASETKLVFRTAKRARDQLAAWGVVDQQADVYRLNIKRLAAIIAGEDAALPPSPRRLGRRRRSGRPASAGSNATEQKGP